MKSSRLTWGYENSTDPGIKQAGILPEAQELIVVLSPSFFLSWKENPSLGKLLADNLQL